MFRKLRLEVMLYQRYEAHNLYSFPLRNTSTSILTADYLVRWSDCTGSSFRCYRMRCHWTYHVTLLLLVSITVHVLVRLTDHYQVYKYMSKQQACMQVNILICELTDVTVLFSVFVARRIFYTKLKTTL